MNRFFNYLRHSFLLFNIMLPCYLFAGAQMSVQDIFQGMTPDQIADLMEESQQMINYIENHASPEEKAEFYKMIEETAQNFTDADKEEIFKIVDVIEPILAEKEALKSNRVEPVKAEPAKKEEVKVVVTDNPFEKTLHKIIKTVNSILLRTKSDSVLAEALREWSKKDDFNELVRLFQVINTKELIAKITTSKEADVKTLLESIENFSKRLDIEDKQFSVADTFGLEVDEKTSVENLKKLHKILEFFNGATETLPPLINKFITMHEPDALKAAKAQDEQAKKALDHAKQIEKMQNKTNPVAYQAPSQSRSGHQTPAQSRREQNKMNAAGGGHGGYPTHYNNQTSSHNRPSQGSAQQSKSGAIGGQPATKQTDKKAGDDKKPTANRSINKDEKIVTIDMLLEKLSDYTGMYKSQSNKNFEDYSKFMNLVSKVFDDFNNEKINFTSQQNIFKAQNGPDKLFEGPLTKSGFYTQQQEDQFESLTNSHKKSFAKHIKKAAQDYNKHKESLNFDVQNQIKDLYDTVQYVYKNMSKLSLQDLEKLQKSDDVKIIQKHVANYQAALTSTRDKLQTTDKNNEIIIDMLDSNDQKEYRDLMKDLKNLSGLNEMISKSSSLIDSLSIKIKENIEKRKMDARKAPTVIQTNANAPKAESAAKAAKAE